MRPAAPRDQARTPNPLDSVRTNSAVRSSAIRSPVRKWGPAALKDPRPRPHLHPNAAAMLYAASAMYPHHPHLGPPAVPSPHRRRPQPFPPSPDPPSPTLPSVSALLRARPASAAGPRKRSLGPSADEDADRPHPQADPNPSATRWDGGRSRAHNVYMQLAGPPQLHPLRPQPRPQSSGDPWAGARFPPLGPRLVDPAAVRSPVGGLGVGLSALGMAGPPSSSSASTGLASPPGGPKASRYLREMDRRVILARIARGEKQSALAKEFQVSRAAICNLYKHRDEVLSRRGGNPLAKHPKKPRPKAGSASSASVSTAPSVKPEPARAAAGAAAAAGPVHELRSRAAALLLTALRREQTDARAFRRSAARLVRLVLEEALALAPLAAVDVALGGGGRADGVALERPPCAVALAASGGQMLAAFADMEPEQPAGRVRFEDELKHEHGAARLEGPALPPALTRHSVLLLEPVADSPSRACAAVRALLARGAAESSVSLVALVVARPVVDALRAAFPALTVVAAQVEEREMERGDALRRRLASARETEAENVSESEW